MAWSTPMTAVTGTQYTAAQYNTYTRDNMLETGVAKVSASGQLLVSTGPNALAARGIAAGITTGGSQSTNSAVYGDLTTVGPAVTLNTGSAVVVCVTAYIANSTAGQGGLMSFAVDGTVPAGVRPLRLMSSAASERSRASAVLYWSGLSAGSHTFKAVYSVVNTGTADFDEREIVVLPLT
jgi:hypothetical protein